jgi:hypothetical protein
MEGDNSLCGSLYVCTSFATSCTKYIDAGVDHCVPQKEVPPGKVPALGYMDHGAGCRTRLNRLGGTLVRNYNNDPGKWLPSTT